MSATQPAPMTVRELMVTEVVTLGRNDQLAVADQAMQEKSIRHMPVVDEDGALVGIVSQRDLVRGALSKALGYGDRAQERMLGMLVVKEVMTGDVIQGRPDMPIATAAALMLQHKIGCLPIVDGGRLVGIVTESDFVALVLADQTAPDEDDAGP